MANNENARPHMALGGQVAVVTGAGLGQEIAKRLGADGAHVVVLERDEASGKATAKENVAVSDSAFVFGNIENNHCIASLKVSSSGTTRTLG